MQGSDLGFAIKGIRVFDYFQLRSVYNVMNTENSVKCLGVKIHSKLSWEEQSENVLKKGKDAFFFGNNLLYYMF